jgi:hypothetical protein
MKKEDVLRIAFQTLDQRQQTYGDPYEGITLMADMLSAYLGVVIEPHDVCIIEIIQKICRLKRVNGDHLDSWVDIAGYAGIGSEVADERKKETTSLKEYLREEFRMEDPSSKDIAKPKGKA